jgi:AcrR family transcriptional regulator
MNNMETGPQRRKGRPRSFDRDAALQAAMLLFWRHGYEATSLSDLTQAMGVTPPSIYTAFGDKKQLFLEAVAKYLAGPVTSQSIIDDAITARAAARGLLDAAVIGFTGARTPPGCLLASAAISCSEAATDVRVELAAIRRNIEERLKNRIDRAVETSELPENTDAAALAAFVMAVIQGLSTLARDGAKREKLKRVADAAMRAWPE